DGTRLYLTAPATELFGGTRSFASGGRDEGSVLVVNVDEKDRPASSRVPNTRLWHKVIGTLPGGLEPYGIKATSFADKMVFTSRMRSSEGLHTITVTNDDPRSFAADVKTISLTLTQNFNQKFQLSIRNPADVV